MLHRLDFTHSMNHLVVHWYRTLLVKVVDINNGLMKNFTTANDFVRHSDSSLVHVKR
jgi:hypothetical protein